MNTLTHGGPGQLHDFISAINVFVEIADKEFPDCPVTGFLRDSFMVDPGGFDPVEFRRYAARAARTCACTSACADRAADAGWPGDRASPDEGGEGGEAGEGGEGVALTAREMVVLSLMADGLIAAAIARQLGISPRTVGKHVENIYRKFGTQDRASAVLRAHSLGLIRPR
jgi:DNA-binding CsgD family transcriptional regulator